MIESIYYSIANKKTNEQINGMLLEFIESTAIPKRDKQIIQHVLEVAQNGHYPTEDYFDTFFTKPEAVTSNLAMILDNGKKIMDFYRREEIIKQTTEAINEATTVNELTSRLSDIADKSEDKSEINYDDYKPQKYSDVNKASYKDGVKIGINEIDSITAGFMRSTTNGICAFTGHGKSQTWISAIFKNVMDGNFCVLMSIELAPSLVWAMFQARYLYEIKGMQDITATDLIQRKLTPEKEALVASYDEDFERDVESHLLIMDESILDKSIVTNFKKIQKMYSDFERKLGGLDLVVWDHVHQLELMFPDCGNIAIRAITSATKTWKSRKGTQCVTGLAVQCNRDGERRARKRDGLYDLQAIGDLNEVERSCTAIVFLYTSEESKIVQETKICMIKNRLGGTLVEPAVITFNPAVSMVGSAVESVAGKGEFDFAGDDFGSSSTDTFGGFDGF